MVDLWLWSLVSILLGFLIIINFISFLRMKEDKERAESHQWRIPECELLLYALLGGFIGIGLGMVFYNHKINKQEFLESCCKCSCCAVFIIAFLLTILFYMFAS